MTYRVIKFNNYFSKICSKLVQSNNEQFTCEIEENPQSMCIQPLTPNDVVAMLNKLKNKYSSGEDQIPTGLIRKCIVVIKDVLTYIINSSLNLDIFPSQLKLSVIQPLYKKRDTDSIENYRSISLLPNFLCNNIIQVFYECNFFSDNQHGYLKNRN